MMDYGTMLKDTTSSYGSMIKNTTSSYGSMIKNTTSNYFSMKWPYFKKSSNEDKK